MYYLPVLLISFLNLLSFFREDASTYAGVTPQEQPHPSRRYNHHPTQNQSRANHSHHLPQNQSDPQLQLHHHRRHHHKRAVPIPAAVTDYLTKYGYLSQANLETQAMRDPEETKKSIKRLQKMAGLPQTGDPRDPRLVELMKKSRCGTKDGKPNKSSDPNAPIGFSVKDYRWDKELVTYQITGFSQHMDQNTQRREIDRAFQIWSDVANIRFQEVSRDADIVVFFRAQDHGDGYPFDGPSGTLAHAFPPGPDRGGDAHFDEHERWSSDGREGTTDLFIVAAHEFGHSIGIFHSEVEDALMFPWYQGYQKDYKLHYDDIVAAQTLYGPSKGGSRGSFATKEPTYSTTTPRPRPRDSQPNPCNTDIDAATNLRGEIFAFKDKWYWRFDQNGALINGRPYETQYFFKLPTGLNVIDAVAEIPGKRERTMYISGNRYWLLHLLDIEYGFPKSGKPLTSLGIPADITKIDAALYWKYNGAVYLFAGYLYWKLDTKGQDLYIADGYPRAFDMWDGIPVPIDAAYTASDNRTFFFRGTQFWEIDNARMMALPGYPKDIGQMWLNCPQSLQSRNSSPPNLSKNVAFTIFGALFITVVFLLGDVHLTG
ncbi:hypothetical protein HELRODRAFT_186073 [Helobdella robusta]|uniref:Peptidase metallopeptidase domain-containing protein n=1 Tax=Helobdella robusta TaxID=6412 RepID=T1FNM7_HELRO|nr:hypothetical protein HELRODRAFT_186073 [Helobdella robusta]ESN93754.1 hypothetical protein HELRODRAFT_186073 [Helobdella robusta]